MMKWMIRPAIALLAGVATCFALVNVTAAAPKYSPPLARLFLQDAKASTLSWADVRWDAADGYSLNPPKAVPGFPALDPAKQSLVQIEQAGGLVAVGVRDTADGAFGSGWVLLRSGVTHEDHGDHAHYSFKRKPEVIDTRIDAAQGNPAHVYQYGGKFFLANDKLNGVTRLDPKEYDGAAKGTPRFLAAGGGHITLAVADDKVAYGTWIDGGGPNKGRVDVTSVAGSAAGKPAYRLTLPSGGLHGATVCAGKVFFAPADGVCWVAADPELKAKPDGVKVHAIPLGKEGDKPLRTGAFATLGTHVLFAAGKESPTLFVLDAALADPQPVRVALAKLPGTAAITPKVVKTSGGKSLAFVFHDRAKDSDAQDTLEVIDLDPNGDGNFVDAKSLKTLPVGKSAVAGHSGHHDLAFDADGRFGFFTNPGDGTVSVLRLKTLDVVATLAVGGTPTAVVACGARDEDD